MTTWSPPDFALHGLEDRTPGSPCDGGWHDEYYCGQIALGCDVSEYRPDIRQACEAEIVAARARYEPGLIRRLLRRSDDGGFL